MLYTIVDINAVLYSNNKEVKQIRLSSNPYDYIRKGYFLDNASLFGGQNNVSYNINIPGNISGDSVGVSDK